MKVKCIYLVDKISGAQTKKDGWLTVDGIYHVLTVMLEYGQRLKFQLIGDDGRTPAFFDASQFEIISDVIPSNWNITFQRNNYFALEPKSWSRPGFLEDYFNGVSEAVLLFESERKKIIEEDP